MVFVPFKKQIYDYYTRRYKAVVLRDKKMIPRHVAVILDGNRRWARQHHFRDVIQGHWKGSETLEEMFDWVLELGIKTLTIWVFSTENAERSIDEINGLMNLFHRKFKEIATSSKIHNNKIRIRALGKLELLDPEVAKVVKEAEEATKDYSGFFLNIAIGYGGRQEIIDAFRSWYRKTKNEGKDMDQAVAELKPDDLTAHCYHPDMTPPDLIIRTSGRIRLSGFMLWHSPYSELYFTDVLWPAFRKLDFLRAIRTYQLRERTFGK